MNTEAERGVMVKVLLIARFDRFNSLYAPTIDHVIFYFTSQNADLGRVIDDV